MPFSATSSSGRYAVVSVTTAVVASAPTGDFLAGAGPRAGPAYLEWRPWQRPWSPGPAASSARIWLARSPTAATTCACSPGAARSSATSTSSSSSGRPATSPTGGPCAGRCRTSIACSTSRAGPRCARRTGSAVFATNLRGARLVFEEALEAGVKRVVHTSSAGAIGVAKPKGTADESTPFEIGHLGNAYVNSKHEAELEAFRFAAHGLDVVIVNPTFVLGPDDPSRTSMGLVRRFCLGQIPAYVDGALNIVDVRDVAAGHLLADAKGEVGERYILGGRNFTFDRLFADLARISGVAPPALKLPRSVALAGARSAARIGLPLPTGPEEILSASLWWTYRNQKARNELGFQPRPHEETLHDAVEWQLAELGDRRAQSTPQGLAMRAVGRAVRAVTG